MPDWLAVDVLPLGPSFVWALRVKSSAFANAAQPWFHVCWGLGRSETYGYLRGEGYVKSILYRVQQTLQELCTFSRIYDDEGDPPVVWNRGAEDPEVKCDGTFTVQKIVVFQGVDMDAWEFADAASMVLLGHPLDLDRPDATTS